MDAVNYSAAIFLKEKKKAYLFSSCIFPFLPLAFSLHFIFCDLTVFKVRLNKKQF